MSYFPAVVCFKICFLQGRREGVKGVTVSRGPDLKRGPGNHENKRKIGYSKEILLLIIIIIYLFVSKKNSYHKEFGFFLFSIFIRSGENF
jgi:hypothetical protein